MTLWMLSIRYGADPSVERFTRGPRCHDRARQTQSIVASPPWSEEGGSDESSRPHMTLSGEESSNKDGSKDRLEAESSITSSSSSSTLDALVIHQGHVNDVLGGHAAERAGQTNSFHL